jgi:hypothetical protein
MPAGEETEQERAQLWALYFGMRALEEPPAFLRVAEVELRWHLEGEPGPPAGLPVRRLRVVD